MAVVPRLLNLGGRVPWVAPRTTRMHAALYRRSGGRVGGTWFDGMPVIVIETVGRKSGRPRATPVIHIKDGDDLVVMAANAGSPRTPAWWLNLRTAGEGVALVGRERRRVRPRVPDPDQHERLWNRFVAAYPAINDYTSYTDRAFPLVVLERV